MKLRFDNLSAGVINIVDIDLNDVTVLETSCGFWSNELVFTFKDGSKETYFDGDYRTDEIFGGSVKDTPEDMCRFLKMFETNLPAGCYKSKRELQSTIDKSK